MQMQQQTNQQNDAYARLEAMRQQAEAAARLNNQQNQNYRPPGWWFSLRPKHLAIELSKLQQNPQHSVELEQYSTEGVLASFFVLAIDSD